MNRLSRLSLYVLAWGPAVLTGCSGGDDSTAVPRRRAYPRLWVEADTCGRAAELGGVEMRINRAATFRHDSLRADWADIEYPAALGATFHLSLTCPGSLPEAVANRRQRMALNLGDAPARSEEFHSGPWACTLVFSDRAGLTTPVQILASNADGRLLSGAVALKAPGTDADSIRPLLELLRDDARTLLLSLR
ncbi:MAG: hypothetical protein K2M06_05355 [Muribaculaceae bacterium]|nr:hypothetical protein [Muribaculaceae bacterium]